MKARHRIALVALTLTACVGCDQQTKSLAGDYLRGRDSISYLGDTLRLDYAENPGAFLSLGAGMPGRWRTAAFTVGAGAGLAAILIYALLAGRAGVVQVLGLSLVCGGGVGNLIDRVAREGLVRDFLNVGVGPLRTGIFNLADVALMAGCLLLVVRELRVRRIGSHG
ncbi:MAG TPA: signal peptidase II [Bryobacteraceae bacterium]|jgi:signal peptidase II